MNPQTLLSLPFCEMGEKTLASSTNCPRSAEAFWVMGAPAATSCSPSPAVTSLPFFLLAQILSFEGLSPSVL